MQQFSGSFLTPPAPESDFTDLTFQVIHTVMDYTKGVEAVWIPRLNPDFILLFGSVSIFICRSGSALSHLAILAREYKKPIFLVKEEYADIPKNGRLSVMDSQIVLL